MTYQESKYRVSFLTTLAVALAYGWHVGGLAGTDGLAGDAAGMMAGRTILILVLAVVGAGILGQIILAAAAKVLRREVVWHEDERDRVVELRAVNMAFSLFGSGFLGALAALAMGQPPALVFHLITGAMLVAGLVADLCRIWLYRRGV